MSDDVVDVDFVDPMDETDEERASLRMEKKFRNDERGGLTAHQVGRLLMASPDVPVRLCTGPCRLVSVEYQEDFEDEIVVLVE